MYVKHGIPDSSSSPTSLKNTVNPNQKAEKHNNILTVYS